MTECFDKPVWTVAELVDVLPTLPRHLLNIAGTSVGYPISAALRERIQGAVSGLCALLDLDADPVTSRDHILLATLLDHAFSQGGEVTLAEEVRPSYMREPDVDINWTAFRSEGAWPE